MGSNPGNQEIAERASEIADAAIPAFLNHPAFQEALAAVQRREPEWVAEFRGKFATLLASHKELTEEVKSLRAYVEKIEAEAHASMEKFSSPEAMMEMAGKFLGGGM